MSTAPLVTRNSARWKPSGSFSRTVFSITRGPAKPISAFGSAITTSPRKANEADTPPMVGSVSTLMKGSFFSDSLVSMAVVLAICISDSKPSCMRAPPVAVMQMNGTFCSSATCAPRTKRSPTTEPMEPPRNKVVGERFVRGAQVALEQKVPFICITATGGARMQEGLLSLMQMAKTTAMLTKLSDKKLPFISVLTDPTMGGVSASFAFMGDVVIAEPKALIGFAGPRVIENTVREKLPEGFQRAEFLVTKGAVDMIVDRRKMREEIARLLALLQNQAVEVLA